MEITRGSIYWVNLNPTQGSEIRKKRPCVVITADPLNRVRRTVVVIPLSTANKAYPPIAIQVTCVQRKVIAILDH